MQSDVMTDDTNVNTDIDEDNRRGQQVPSLLKLIAKQEMTESTRVD